MGRKEESPARGPEVYAFREEIGSDRRGVVQCHLLEPEGQREQDGAQRILPRGKRGKSAEGKAEHDAIVLEVAKVDEQEGRVEKEGDEGRVLHFVRGFF